MHLEKHAKEGDSPVDVVDGKTYKKRVYFGGATLQA